MKTLERLQNAIAIHLYRRDGKEVSVLTGLEFKPREINKLPEEEILLPIETAQELMDSLWQCGLRPSEGSGSAGALSATQNHLKDMQSLSQKLLAMIEKKVFDVE